MTGNVGGTVLFCVELHFSSLYGFLMDKITFYQVDLKTKLTGLDRRNNYSHVNVV